MTLLGWTQILVFFLAVLAANGEAKRGRHLSPADEAKRILARPMQRQRDRLPASGGIAIRHHFDPLRPAAGRPGVGAIANPPLITQLQPRIGQ